MTRSTTELLPSFTAELEEIRKAGMTEEDIADAVQEVRKARKDRS